MPHLSAVLRASLLAMLNFLAMVRQAYPLVYRPAQVPQPDGSWLISGCVLVPDRSQGT